MPGPGPEQHVRAQWRSRVRRTAERARSFQRRAGQREPTESRWSRIEQGNTCTAGLEGNLSDQKHMFLFQGRAGLRWHPTRASRPALRHRMQRAAAPGRAKRNAAWASYISSWRLSPPARAKRAAPRQRRPRSRVHGSIGAAASRMQSSTGKRAAQRRIDAAARCTRNADRLSTVPPPFLPLKATSIPTSPSKCLPKSMMMSSLCNDCFIRKYVCMS